MSAKVKGGVAASVTVILAAIFAVEGGYVNDPADRGGETNMGITKKVAVAHGYSGPMRDLPKGVARDIYIATYIEAPGFMPIVAAEPAVAEELVDSGVNMGPVRPSRWFQQSLNHLAGAKLKVDGRVGPASVAAFKGYQLRVGRVPSCVAMLDRLDAVQLAFYDGLVRADPTQKRFYKGWKRMRIGNVDRRHCGKDAL